MSSQRHTRLKRVPCLLPLTSRKVHTRRLSRRLLLLARALRQSHFSLVQSAFSITQVTAARLAYCPKCSKFATPATTAKHAATPKVIRRFGYNWGPLLDWAGEHPLLVVFLFLVGVFSIGALFSDSNTQPSASSSSATPSSASPTPFTNNAKAASRDRTLRIPAITERRSRP